MRMIVDAGLLIALLARTDAHHDSCTELLTSYKGPMLVPATVIVEVCWTLEKFQGSQVEAHFLDLVTNGTFELVELTPTDVNRMAELVGQYANFPSGLWTPR